MAVVTPRNKGDDDDDNDQHQHHHRPHHDFNSSVFAVGIDGNSNCWLITGFLVFCFEDKKV